jgi:hypothetical protein
MGNPEYLAHLTPDCGKAAHFAIELAAADGSAMPDASVSQATQYLPRASNLCMYHGIERNHDLCAREDA